MRLLPTVRDSFQTDYWEHHAHGRKWSHPVVSFFIRQRLDYLKHFIDWSTVESVLDVGCGYGSTLYYLKEKVVFRVGVDRSAVMLSGCPKEAGRLLQGHVATLPFRDRVFDCVLGWEILHHLENPEKAVKEFARVSRRYIILFEPNRYNPVQCLLGLLDRSERGTLSFSKKRLEALVRRSGLALLHSATVGATFPNRMPTLLLPLVRQIPFHLPFMGITSLVIGLKKC